MHQGVRLGLLLLLDLGMTNFSFFGTDFTDFTDFFVLAGIAPLFRLHAEAFEKREITGRNITVMVRAY